MKAQVVGIRSTNFSAKETGEVISGLTVYILFEDENVQGFVSDRLFLSDNKLAHFRPCLKDIVNIEYNRFGKVASIQKVEE